MHEQVSQPTWCGRHGTAAASSQHLSSSRTFLATPSATLSCSRTRLPLLDSTSSCPTFWEGSRCVAHARFSSPQQACGQHGHGFHPPVEAHVVPMLLWHCLVHHPPSLSIQGTRKQPSGGLCDISCSLSLLEAVKQDVAFILFWCLASVRVRVYALQKGSPRGNDDRG
jgi:hypothetical protein